MTEHFHIRDSANAESQSHRATEPQSHRAFYSPVTEYHAAHAAHCDHSRADSSDDRSVVLKHKHCMGAFCLSCVMSSSAGSMDTYNEHSLFMKPIQPLSFI
jgi:hypothetical protein